MTLREALSISRPEKAFAWSEDRAIWVALVIYDADVYGSYVYWDRRIWRGDPPVNMEPLDICDPPPRLRDLDWTPHKPLQPLEQLATALEDLPR